MSDLLVIGVKCDDWLVTFFRNLGNMCRLLSYLFSNSGNMWRWRSDRFSDWAIYIYIYMFLGTGVIYDDDFSELDNICVFRCRSVLVNDWGYMSRWTSEVFSDWGYTWGWMYKWQFSHWDQIWGWMSNHFKIWNLPGYFIVYVDITHQHVDFLISYVLLPYA